MAENIVHTSSVRDGKLSSPNLIEIAANESLESSIQPSIKIIGNFIAVNKPRYAFLHRYSDELVLAILTLLHLMHLKRNEASFGETLYGLKRNPKASTSPHRMLYISLASLTLFPYVRAKLQNVCNALQMDMYGERMKIKELAVNLFKAINVSYESLKLAYFVSYLTRNSGPQTPLLDLAGATLVHSPGEEVQSKRDFWEILTQAASICFQFGAFSFQFFKWWDREAVRKLNLPVPKAPQKSSSSKLCPLCGKNFRTEVVLSTSGFVFCFRCAKDYLVKNKKCPITNVPSSLTELVRLYPPKD